MRNFYVGLLTLYPFKEEIGQMVQVTTVDKVSEYSNIFGDYLSADYVPSEDIGDQFTFE
jgi:hypothetical protein